MEAHTNHHRLDIIILPFLSVVVLPYLFVCFLLFVGYRIVGIAIYFNMYSTFKGPAIRLEDLYVMQEFRGKYNMNCL